MRGRLSVAAWVLVLACPALAQDKPGTVTVVESKEIWKADGMTVTHAQFTPDGERIIFVVQGKDGFLVRSVKPDGSGLAELFRGKETKLRDVKMWIAGTRLTALLKTEEKGYALRVDVAGGDYEMATYREATLEEPPGGPYKLKARSPRGTLFAAAKDLPSPVGIVRGAGLWVWKAPKPNDRTVELREVLSPKDWLVGVAYYKHLIAWAPLTMGEKEDQRIRFVGARIKPFPGKKYRPLCVWEVTINDKLERVGELKSLGTFGWWPRYFRGDPALHGCTGWNVGIGSGQYLADLQSGKVYKFDKQAFGRGTRASYNPGCTLAALPGKTLKVLRLKKTD